MPNNKFTDFDVFTIPLEGRNLVEASAGTGKTYSIGLLTIRLLIEKGFDLKKILLVTFTNAATAELETRIRSFVRIAHDYALGEKTDHEAVKKVVDNGIQKTGKDIVLQRLKDAILFLDELSIMTIHGFCMQTLTNHAFPSGQLFGSQLLSNTDEIITRYVQKFWREQITTLPVPILQPLLAIGLSIESITSAIKAELAGIRYFAYDPLKKYNLDSNKIEELSRQLQHTEKNQQKIKAEFSRKIIEDQIDLDGCFHKRKRIHIFKQYITDHDTLFEEVLNARHKKELQACLEDTGLMEIVNEFAESDPASVASGLASDIYCVAIQNICANIHDHLLMNGILSFDQLIKNLHTALTGERKEELALALGQEYDAVFIDEFQDTDKYQYEIFNTAFGKRSVLFYIGDPKQSIYAFRQADINTYFKAVEGVDKRYSMNINFRSTSKMIEAMNRFFLPVDDFDTFLFPDDNNAIRYIPVNVAKQNMSETFLNGNKESEPITIYENNGESVTDQTAMLVYELLTNENLQLHSNAKGRKIIPKDIGILVKSNESANAIHHALSRYNIPSILYSDKKIMETAQARELYYFLQAVYDPNPERINTALLSEVTGYRHEDILKLDHEILLGLFKNYNITWQSQGVYSCIAAFKKDFAIENFLTNPATENGLRIISNINQLTEILFQKEYHQKLKPAELLDWLKRAMQSQLLDEDEAEIRLENDEDAVTISTIHKSKGLAYNIVILPNFDFLPRLKDSVFQVYKNGTYISIPKKELDEETKQLIKEQQHRELRRLMYVALTRSVYKAFLFKKMERVSESGFSKIYSELKQTSELNAGLIDITHFSLKQPHNMYSVKTEEKSVKKEENIFIKLLDTNWKFLSYSSLSVYHNDPFVAAQPKSSTEKTDYDHFIFEQLIKGTVTGNMIHEIFETINFSKEERHHKNVKYIIDRYGGRNREPYLQFIPQLIDHVLESNLVTESHSFRLSDVHSQNKLNELEFDYTLTDLQTEEIAGIAAEYGLPVQLQDPRKVKGLMNGFIDLLFQHNGKYYLLDWKSNFLGASEEDYNKDNMQKAMELFNYHLQYLIYTIALKRFLQKTFGQFDYETFGGVFYCFIRGMRANKSNGIFYSRPEPDLINQLDKAMMGVALS